MFTANIYTPLDRGMVLTQLCRWKFSHKDCFKNACSPQKFSRSLKSEDKDLQTIYSPRVSSRTSTFLEDNNSGIKQWSEVDSYHLFYSMRQYRCDSDGTQTARSSNNWSSGYWGDMGSFTDKQNCALRQREIDLFSYDRPELNRTGLVSQ